MLYVLDSQDAVLLLIPPYFASYVHEDQIPILIPCMDSSSKLVV